ncbi:STAS domain-containing protein [Ferrimonas lipolytica]|uniref:STAS domain-containing protein n=1 Tax=Ferrimonas lipolytica TaxID=2724191 RepID=A0A6H1UF33_9GAMM|nr:STAS domain-containing protein [Ferrimonas lipolytica]QIZ77691.1 STAS domain-containing protein [Ferrimonas lipolytica]
MSNESSIVLNKIERRLIATVQSTLTDEVLARFQQQLLLRLTELQLDYLLCDLSGIDIIDIEEFEALSNIFKMASLMGVNTILVGLNPGLAATIVDFDLDTSAFMFARNIEHGLELSCHG